MARVDQEELATAREKLKQISSILDDCFIEITELGCAENEHNDGQLINLVEMLHAIGIICEIERERCDNCFHDNCQLECGCACHVLFKTKDIL